MPDALPPSERRPALTADPLLRQIQSLGYVLDNSIRIPGIGYRIGLDAIIGLIPGIGDAVGTVLSAYIVLQAARYGVRKRTLGRMIFNVALEAIVGAVPLVGDLFDAGWKANSRNLDLLAGHLNRSGPRKPSNRRVLLLVGLLLALLFAGVIALVVFLGGLLVDLIRSR